MQCTSGDHHGLMTVVVADHESIERLLRPSQNRADQDRGRNGPCVAGKAVRQADGAFATNAPKDWPSIHQKLHAGMDTTSLIDTVVASLQDAIALRERLAATDVLRVGPRGVLRITAIMSDGVREIPVFVYDKADEATARKFANARDICAMLGMDEAVFFAPKPLTGSIGAGAEEPLSFKHFKPGHATGATPRSSVWGDDAERRELVAAWRAFDKSVQRHAPDFAAALFSRGHSGRLRGIRLPSKPVGAWLEAPDGIVVEATAGPHHIRLAFPEEVPVHKAITIIHGMRDMAEEFKPQVRVPRVFTPKRSIPMEAQRRPEPAMVSIKEPSPVEVPVATSAPVVALPAAVSAPAVEPAAVAPAPAVETMARGGSASTPSANEQPAPKTPETAPRPRANGRIARGAAPIVRGSVERIGRADNSPITLARADAPRSTAIARAMRSHSAQAPDQLAAPARQASPDPGSAIEAPLPQAGRFTKAAVEAVTPDPPMPETGSRKVRLAPPAQFNEDGYFMPDGKPLPTPGEFNMSAADRQFLA